MRLIDHVDVASLPRTLSVRLPSDVIDVTLERHFRAVVKIINMAGNFRVCDRTAARKLTILGRRSPRADVGYIEMRNPPPAALAVPNCKWAGDRKIDRGLGGPLTTRFPR